MVTPEIIIIEDVHESPWGGQMQSHGGNTWAVDEIILNIYLFFYRRCEWNG